MLRQYARRILRPHWLLGIFGVLFALFSARDVASVFGTQVKSLKLDNPSLLEFAGFVGLIVLSLLILRSVITDFLSLSGERRIVAGSAQAGTDYDYRTLFSKDPKRVVLIAQNMHTVIQDSDYLPCISRWLQRNKDSGATLTIILSTPKALGVLSSKARNHLKLTVDKLDEFLAADELASTRTNVRLHPGATTLSAFVCDPDSRKTGILVFNPKWAVDTLPANRLYCVLEKWENPDLFDLLAGVIPALTAHDRESLSLEEAKRVLTA